MKKPFISLILVLVVVTMTTTGCTQQLPAEFQSLSLVMGVHRYFPAISLNTAALVEKIQSCAYSYGHVSVVLVDGEPTPQLDFDINDPNKDINEAKKRQLAKTNAKNILSAIATIKAEEPQIDTLKAITVSSNILNSKDDSLKSMVIFDSGLSTTGLLDFAHQNLLDTSVESIVSQLKALYAIPDLSGIDVTWIGLGQVCGDQTQLTSKYQFKLQSLWKAILTAGGASSVTFDTTQMANNEVEADLPVCSLVPIPEDSINVDKIELVKFDETGSVKFVMDQAVFIDETAATEELLPIAAYLKRNPDAVIYVVGMTATVGSADSGKKLSLARAQACYRILVKNGANPSQMITIGLGHAPNNLRVADTDSSGNLIETMAQYNRAVFFIDSHSAIINTLVNISKN